jgi:pimeloyl-ACP methyl ester carboxylesterase
MKRTNVRFFYLALKLGLSTIAPRFAERIALRWLMTPSPGAASRIPKVEGMVTFHRTLSTGFHQLAAWEWGHGPAVLLLHGWNGQASDLEAFVAPLVQAGYRVLAADLPAHGRSSGARASIGDWRRAVSTMARYAGTVQGVIAEGLGATVALLAAQDGEPLRRLTLLSPPPSVEASVREQALALGYPAGRLPDLLRERELEHRVTFDALDLRRIANRLALPSLVLEDARNREGVVHYAVTFLQQGAVQPQSGVAHTAFKVAV